MGKRVRGQRKGRGFRHSAPSHRFPGRAAHPKVRNESGMVVDIINSVLHSAPLAVMKFGQQKFLSVASEGLQVGQKVYCGDNVRLASGNITQLKAIPEGTPIFNIEGQPGDGGKYCRTAGNAAVVEAHLGSGTSNIKLPSGVVKSFNSTCRAVIGMVAGGGRAEKPFVKAGNRHHKMKARGKLYPTVSGVAMNPVSHPHGGGNHQHVGQPSTVARSAPPGRKVGSIAAKRTGVRK